MRAVIAICAMLCAAPAQASSVWTVAARAYNLDPLALYSVALQESRMLRPDGTARPWPWTLRSARNGPERFTSYAGALSALESLLAAGESNIDIGVMQVNWGINGHRVEDPAALLDPYRNVLVGAAILHEALQVHEGNLEEALGAYHHRAGSQRADRYSAEVRRRMARLRELPGLSRRLAGENAR